MVDREVAKIHKIRTPTMQFNPIQFIEKQKQRFGKKRSILHIYIIIM